MERTCLPLDIHEHLSFRDPGCLKSLSGLGGGRELDVLLNPVQAVSGHVE